MIPEHVGMRWRILDVVMLADDVRGSRHSLPLDAVATVDMAFVVAPVAHKRCEGREQDRDDTDHTQHFGPATSEDDWLAEERGNHAARR